MPILQHQLLATIKNILDQARKQVVQAVNITMVKTYFEIGKIIVEDEQNGENRAGYGKETLKNLSMELTKEYGKGFSETNLKQMKSFYIVYSTSQKGQTLSDEFTKPSTVLTESPNFNLSWSHYLILMRMDEVERAFYEKESSLGNWSVRQFQRQIDSGLFERVTLSRDKNKVLEASLKTYHEPKNSGDIVKDPLILEFLGLEEKSEYSESDLEKAIISKIEHFLLEIGKGFAFVGRQKRFTFEEEHFFVDLVFYNRLLKCFVLVDLKIGKLKHQDLGQMQMYVNYYDRFVKTEDENPTVGIVLCKDKKDSMVEITLPKNSQIFTSKYQLYLPNKEELKRQIEDKDM
jgi:predicted nuclease of restriction endonuclease-like (RecB) superfamily